MRKHVENVADFREHPAICECDTLARESQYLYPYVLKTTFSEQACNTHSQKGD
jgi:hypothetical protein